LPKTFDIQNLDAHSFDAKQRLVLQQLERLINAWARQADEMTNLFL